MRRGLCCRTSKEIVPFVRGRIGARSACRWCANDRVAAAREILQQPATCRSETIVTARPRHNPRTDAAVESGAVVLFGILSVTQVTNQAVEAGLQDLHDAVARNKPLTTLVDCLPGLYRRNYVLGADQLDIGVGRVHEESTIAGAGPPRHSPGARRLPEGSGRFPRPGACA